MSRIRSIHPGLWTDEAFVSLSPYARLFVMGLWNECDDAGCFAWSPVGLKMRLLPADNVDATELLAEIEAAGIVMRYSVGGKPYGAVRNFCQFQRPKKPNSVHPKTPEVENWTNANARTVRDGGEGVPNELPTGGEKPRQMEDGGGNKEGCSNEQPSPAKRGSGKTLLPANWQLPPASSLPPKARACAEQWTDASYQTEGEGFVLYWRSIGRMMKDWDATWANRVISRHSAVMRDQKFGNAAPAANATKQDLTPAEWEARADQLDRVGMPDAANECRMKARQAA